MTNEIINNIEMTLKKPLEKERVAYLMIEIRKFIERKEGEIVKWGSLKYWCDWTMHTALSYGFARNTLSAIEDYFLENPGEKFQWSYFNSHFVSLQILREELFEFLKFNNLPTKITDVPQWYDFSKYLVEILRDCPLTKEKGLVREFLFIKKDHIPEAEKYSIDFEVHFDGTKQNIDGSVLIYEDERRFLE